MWILFFIHPSLILKKKIQKLIITTTVPIVISYPEVIKNNMDELHEKQVKYYHPFLPFDHKDKLAKRLYDVLEHLEISWQEIYDSVNKAWRELESFKEDIRINGEQTLRYMRSHQLKGIVLAGRPYHVDLILITGFQR